MPKIGISNTIPNIVNLPGQSGGGSVFSTKALEFDGTDDYVGCGASATLQPTGAFTVSGWIYIDDLANNNVILANNTSVGANGYVLWITAATTNAIFTVYTGATYGWVAVQGTTNFVTGQWYHVAGTYAGTSADMKIYVNGQLENTVTSSPATIAYGTEGYIGKYNVGRTEGKIDEVALFGSALGAPVIDSIYNFGVPTDLTSLTPIAWWRCGENATFKEPQILMPEQSNKDKVSNYSMDFDGVTSYIDTSDATLVNGYTDVTFSGWINVSSLAADYEGIICARGSDYILIHIGNIVGSTYTLYVQQTQSGQPATITYTLSLNFDSWYHFAIMGSVGGKWDMYINGSNAAQVQGPNTISGLTQTQSFNIGRDYASRELVGKIDEVSIFDEVKAIGELWDGTGKPTDLTEESGLVSWWRMGEEAIFDPAATEWTIPDQIGSNDGTSANMDIYARVGDAPDSPNNALSYNMDAVDIVPR